MKGYVGIELVRSDTGARSDLHRDQALVEIKRRPNLIELWAVDGKVSTEEDMWSFGASETGGGDNRKGVFSGGRVDTNPLLQDKNGSPCQAQAEGVAKLLLVKYLNASTSMGAEEFVICTDNVSSVVNLMDRSRGGTKHKFSERFRKVLLMLATELWNLLLPRKAALRFIHRQHPDAYQRDVSPQAWDPDRVAALGLKECDMRPEDWQVESYACALTRLKFTEATWGGKKRSLLLSVKVEAVPCCGELLKPVVEPRDVWIRAHWKGRWVWRHVESDEKFWEDTGMPVACDDGNATDSVGIQWENYCDVKGQRVWVNLDNRWFYESTGTRWLR